MFFWKSLCSLGYWDFCGSVQHKRNGCYLMKASQHLLFYIVCLEFHKVWSYFLAVFAETPYMLSSLLQHHQCLCSSVTNIGSFTLEDFFSMPMSLLCSCSNALGCSWVGSIKCICPSLLLHQSLLTHPWISSMVIHHVSQLLCFRASLLWCMPWGLVG